MVNINSAVRLNKETSCQDGTILQKGYLGYVLELMSNKEIALVDFTKIGIYTVYTKDLIELNVNF